MAVARLETRGRGRRWSVLVPFLQKAEYDSLLMSGNNFELWDHEPPEDAWRRAQRAAESAPVYSASATLPLADQLAGAAAELKSREVFTREYARKADVRLGMVPLNALVSPQPAADMDYVDELVKVLGSNEDLRRDFAFSFPLGDLPDPIVSGQMVVFNSQTPNVLVNPLPEWHRIGDEIQISIRATARPNYLWVAEMGPRLILLNGVHKVLAAIRAGRNYLPAIIRQATSVPELGLQPSPFLNQLLVPRPPLVTDFLHPMAITMVRRPTRMLTRLIVQADQIPFPE
jgi:hypothetical protein